MEYFNLTFTAPDDTSATGYTEGGVNLVEWSFGSGATLKPKISGNAMVAGELSATNAQFSADTIIPSADHFVKGVIEVDGATTNGIIAVTGHGVPASGNGYAAALFFDTDSAAIFRFDGGGGFVESSQALPGGGAGIVSGIYEIYLIFSDSGSTVSMKLHRMGDDQWLQSGGLGWTGTESICCTSSSSEYTAAGKAGFWFSTGPANAKLLNLSAEDGAVDSTAPTLTVPVGTGGIASSSGTFTSDEAGTVYWKTTATNTPESVPAYPTAMTGWTSQAMSSGANSITSLGTTPGTYWLQVVGQDASNNRGAAPTVSASSFTITAEGGTFTSEPLKLNNGTVLASQALNYVALYNDTTNALVIKKTGLSTDGSGIFTFTDVLVVPGTTYRVDWEAASGQRRMPRKAAT